MKKKKLVKKLKRSKTEEERLELYILEQRRRHIKEIDDRDNLQLQVKSQDGEIQALMNSISNYRYQLFKAGGVTGPVSTSRLEVNLDDVDVKYEVVAGNGGVMYDEMHKHKPAPKDVKTTTLNDADGMYNAKYNVEEKTPEGWVTGSGTMAKHDLIMPKKHSKTTTHTVKMKLSDTIEATCTGLTESQVKILFDAGKSHEPLYISSIKIIPRLPNPEPESP